jgi:acyl-[acyl-carrier-protein] desaturase
MKHKVVMPAHLMTDDQDPDLFDHFSTVAQRLGVYTANDYAEIIQHLVRQWKLETICGLVGKAAEAQDYLCKLGPRFAKLAERNNKRQTEATSFQFSWIYNRSV